MQMFARLKSIVLAVQNHYEGASAVPALPALPKTNEDATVWLPIWAGKGGLIIQRRHMPKWILRLLNGNCSNIKFTPSDVYPGICMFRNKFRSLFSDLLIRFSVNIIQFRALASRQGQHAKSSDPST
jgi:hypothetical protein